MAVRLPGGGAFRTDSDFTLALVTAPTAVIRADGFDARFAVNQETLATGVHLQTFWITNGASFNRDFGCGSVGRDGFTAELTSVHYLSLKLALCAGGLMSGDARNRFGKAESRVTIRRPFAAVNLFFSLIPSAG